MNVVFAIIGKLFLSRSEDKGCDLAALCDHFTMTKAEHIRSLLDSLPEGAPVRASDMGAALAEAVGCSPSEASNTARQVMLGMERDAQIERVFRGVYVKTCGNPLDLDSPDVLLPIADQMYVDHGRAGYYRGRKALERYGLGGLAKDGAARIATNESAGRQTALARRLGVVIEKPTAAVDPENAKYLEALDMISEHVDALMGLDDDAIERLFARLEREGIDYKKLMGFASKCGSVRSVRAAARLCERLL